MRPIQFNETVCSEQYVNRVVGPLNSRLWTFSAGHCICTHNRKFGADTVGFFFSVGKYEIKNVPKLSLYFTGFTDKILDTM
jgi:hypothetical protein